MATDNLKDHPTVSDPMAEYQRIPGLPYTYEDRMEALRISYEQSREGLSITSEEFDKEMEKW